MTFLRYILFLFVISSLQVSNAQDIGMHDFMAILNFEVEVNDIGIKLKNMGFNQFERKGEILDTISWTRDCKEIHEPQWTITDVRSDNASALRLVYDPEWGMIESLHLAVIGEEMAKTLTQELKTMGFKKAPTIQNHVWKFYNGETGWEVSVWENNNVYSFRVWP